MDVLTTYQDVPQHLRGASMALGNFDGIHPGHVSVISRAKPNATGESVPWGVISFEPHPRQFFRPADPTFRLTSLHAKGRVLSHLGLDYLAALPFDEELSSMPAKDFAKHVLAEGLNISNVVVGADFGFGKGRDGDAESLRSFGEQFGFRVDIVPLISGPHAATGKDAFSSTAVRAALRDGDMAHASEWLGRIWSVDGQIQKGDQRGRQLGFPTINVPMGGYLHPALGGYALFVEILDGPHAGVYDAVGNVGKRPTFDKKDVLLEAHLFDFQGDLYGAHAYVYFAAFLRPEQKFDGLDGLKAQIAEDCDNARRILAGLKPARLIGR